MHEFSPSNTIGFRGQLGFIPFDPSCRLPRHIHMTANRTKFLNERIMVLHGVGLVELAGDYYVVAPGSLTDCIGGVPHTWTACPPGIKLPGGEVSDGKFTMVYEYEEETSFFPTRRTEVVKSVENYEAWEGDLEEIRFPELTREEVVKVAKGVVWNGEVRGVELVGDGVDGILRVN